MLFAFVNFIFNVLNTSDGRDGYDYPSALFIGVIEIDESSNYTVLFDICLDKPVRGFK